MTALDSPLHNHFEVTTASVSPTPELGASTLVVTALTDSNPLVHDSVKTGESRNPSYFSLFENTRPSAVNRMDDTNESILRMVELVDEGVSDPFIGGHFNSAGLQYASTPDGNFLEKLGRIEAENARLQNAKFEQEYANLTSNQKQAEQQRTNSYDNDQTLQLAQNYNGLPSGLQQIIGKSLQNAYEASIDPNASVLDPVNIEKLSSLLNQLPTNTHGVIGSSVASKLVQEISRATDELVASLAESFTNQSPMIQNAARESLTAQLRGNGDETPGNATTFLEKMLSYSPSSSTLLLDESISSLDQPGAPEWDTTNAEYLIEQLKASGKSGPEIDRLIAKAEAKIESANEYIAQQKQLELQLIQERLDAQQTEEDRRNDQLQDSQRDEDVRQKQNDEERQKSFVQLTKMQGFNSILDRQLEHYTSIKLQSADGREATSLMHGHDDDMSAALSVLEVLDTPALGTFQGGQGETRFSSETTQSSLPTITPMQVIHSTNPISAFDFDDDTPDQTPQRPGSRV